MTLLIDGDILLYRMGYVNQDVIEWEADCTSEFTDIEKAKKDFDRFVKLLMKDTKATDYIICLSGSNNFRYRVEPTYKHNRKESSKPILYTKLKEYVLEAYADKLKIKDDLEADDVMGIMATMKPNKYIIATIDKDLKQIPSKHYNWNEGVLFEVTKESGDYYFYTQVLTGDPTDGYSGCKGIGAVGARKILEAVDDGNYWVAIVEAYESKGYTEEDAIKQARLARILRASDYDFKNKKVRLWTPPKKRKRKRRKEDYGSKEGKG